MKKLVLVAMMALLAGCASSSAKERRVEVAGATVVVAAGHNLHDAVVQAATRRHWCVQELENGDLRCKIIQRSNVVAIDIVIVDETTYDIKFVESNIPTRKYNKWVQALQREIAMRAAM